MNDEFDKAELAPASKALDVEPMMGDGKFTIAALLRVTFWVAVWAGALRLFWDYNEIIDRWLSAIVVALFVAAMLASIIGIVWYCPWERKNSPRL